MVPAIAVADELRDRGCEVSFAGTPGRAEADLVPGAGYEIDFIDVRGIDRRNPLRAGAAAARAALAVRAARRILRARGAGVVMGGGGYVAGPVGLAAVRAGVPHTIQVLSGQTVDASQTKAVFVCPSISDTVPIIFRVAMGAPA